MRTVRNILAVAFWAVTLVMSGRAQGADPFDPPVNYYSSATGTGATLKSQLNNVIDDHTVSSYDNARYALQVTDEDPNDPARLILVYNRVSLNTSNINPGGPIPGWNGSTWNREHTWPDSRLPGGSAVSDLHNLRPSTNSVNSDRGNLNFGGAYGQQSFGKVTDKGALVWYPGNADAGMIARQEFYMSVRYGTDSGGSNLQLVNGNPPDGNNSLGDLARLIEWHYAAAPDSFERRRNQIIYDSYQHNRNPFVDRPEYAWSIFVNQVNDSSLGLQGATPTANGATSVNLDLGRVLLGAPVPTAQAVTLAKSGLNGTYYQVTSAGLATSSVNGRYNSFATGTTGAKAINVGLATTTATAGLRNGTVTIDNLDVTSGGGLNRGASDGNDVVNVTMTVLNHANPSFDATADVNSLVHDFGTLTAGANAPTFSFDIFNLPTTAGFNAGLDLDSIVLAGDASKLSMNAAPFSGATTLAAGSGTEFIAALDTSTVGAFSATYTLGFSDENLPGAAALGTMTLTLMGVVEAATVANTADFNADGLVDGADFLTWQRGIGAVDAALIDGDANGDRVVDAIDLAVWSEQFGVSATPPVQAVPEPAAATIACCCLFASLIFIRWNPVRRSSR